jgi:hypothetical protein
MGKTITGVSDEVMDLFMSYDFPGQTSASWKILSSIAYVRFAGNRDLRPPTCRDFLRKVSPPRKATPQGIKMLDDV